MNAVAKAEILSRYEQHVARFERDAESRSRRGLTLVVSEPPKPAKAVGANLSKREQSILELVAQGLTDIEIANEIGLSQYTVKTHIRRVYEKLAAKNRPHAVTLGFQQGLLSLS
jgi:DNA-binding NarL/FixJ family response regulator